MWFVELMKDDDCEISVMSKMATAIVREHAMDMKTS